MCRGAHSPSLQKNIVGRGRPLLYVHTCVGFSYMYKLCQISLVDTTKIFGIFQTQSGKHRLTVNVSLNPLSFFFLPFCQSSFRSIIFLRTVYERCTTTLISQHSCLMSKHLHIYYYIPSNDSLDAHGTSLYISFTSY